MFTVSKDHRFEAAHRLVNGYQGNCAHVHGHSWKVSFKCSGESLNSFGMLRDFSSFKIIRKWVDENLDHATMVSKNDEVLIAWLKENNQRHYICEDNPTSEHLTVLLFNKCRELGITDITTVTVEETCTSCASYGT